MDPRETALRYDRIAALWDVNRQQSRQGVRFLERALQHCKAPGKALDVGCGTGGHMMARLLESGLEVTGLDASEGMLGLARQRHPGVNFVHGDIVGWTPPAPCALIVAWDSIFHLPYDQHAPVLEKLCGSLAPGGVLLFTAGGIDGRIVGEMFGIEFAYSSLSDLALLRLLEGAGCVPILVERDQYPLHHLVVLAIAPERA